MLDPVRQFTDNTGKPLAMGSFASYIAGTVTPHPTYADSALSQPNENPIPLDSAGRATIYLDQIVYKFALFDAKGIKVWERDNVPGTVWPGTVNAMSIKNAMPNANAYGHQFSSLMDRASSGTHT